MLNFERIADVMPFYCDILGFKLSDYFLHPFPAYFLHVNTRHHSLALVETGDWITLDVPGRRLELHVDEATLATRRAAWTAPVAHFDRGYGALFLEHVLQADRGVDFDFLVGGSGSGVPKDNH